MHFFKHDFYPFLAKRFLYTLSLCVLLFTASSCDSDKIDAQSYYTFIGETVVSYLEKNPDQFSEMSAVLEFTGLDALLATYGTFTCFIPTNEAMRAYYADSSKNSYSEFSVESLQEMVFYQIIDTKRYLSTDFPQGRLANKNMMSRFIDISFENYAQDGGILVNSSSTIKLKDQEVHNGVIHVIDRVLVPSTYLLPESIRSDSSFSLFGEALYLTGLSDSLLGIRDDSYVQPISFLNAGGGTVPTPPDRLYGYTALVEPDSVYAEYGIFSLDDLKAYAAAVYDEVFPEDAVYANNFTHRKNSLNRFVAYHLFDYLCYYNEFVDYYYNHGGMMEGKEGVEYIQTMCPNTLLEVRAGNRFNVQKTGEHISILGKGMKHTTCVNGIFHPIDKILLYDASVINDVLNKRIRIDVYSTLPEMMNIKARGVDAEVEYYYPSGFFKNLKYKDDETKVNSKRPTGGAVSLQGDRFHIYGWYDFTHILPPVPEGSWEIRIGIKTRERNIVQIYVDNVPNGIPLDMGKNAEHPDIGYIADANTDDDGISNDKDLRNRGWMKAPDYFCQYPQGKSGRLSTHSLRRILGIYSLGDGNIHTFRMKSVLSSNTNDYFGYDYIEFIPKGLLDTEDRN
jgi:uncharacterized surface protein with fasciclin (FAS1) repeats